VDGRRCHTCGKDGVAELEQSVGTVIEALVERVPKGTQSVESGEVSHSEAFCSRESSMATPAADPPPVRLKHKLRFREFTFYNDYA
jgi:hypothetical protein